MKVATPEFSGRARRDLDEIRDWTIQTWGAARWQAYYRGIGSALRRIASDPNCGRPQDKLAKGMRIPSNLTDVVASGVRFLKGALQAVGLCGSRLKFYFRRQFHKSIITHGHYSDKSSMALISQAGLRQAQSSVVELVETIPPTAKAGGLPEEGS